MVSHLVFYQLDLIILVFVFLILYGLWPSEPVQLVQCPPSR